MHYISTSLQIFAVLLGALRFLQRHPLGHSSAEQRLRRDVPCLARIEGKAAVPVKFARVQEGRRIRREVPLSLRHRQEIILEGCAGYSQSQFQGRRVGDAWFTQMNKIQVILYFLYKSNF